MIYRTIRYNILLYYKEFIIIKFNMTYKNNILYTDIYILDRNQY